MTEGIYFADAELPFHVWVRERRGEGYRWVLREARGDEAAKDSVPGAPEATGDGEKAA